MNTMDTFIENLLTQNDFRDNDFFKNIKKEMSKENFINTQNQFYYAVVNFVSPLALVAAAIPTYEDRVNIIKNLWEEHGEGDMSLTHGSTFTELLRRLTNIETPVIPKANEAVTVFNKTLNDVAIHESYLKSVAAIGMIERMFADISALIGTAIVERGWLPKDQVIHYALHQELDCIHAEDFFSIIRKNYDNPENRELINDGLELGMNTFLNLYQDLNDEVHKN